MTTQSVVAVAAPLRNLALILSYWKPVGFQGERRPRDDPSASSRRGDKVFPLAWVAAHPWIRDQLECNALGHDDTFVRIAHVSCSQRRLPDGELPDTLRVYDYQRSDPARCQATVTVHKLPLHASGLPLTAWWIKRCEAEHTSAHPSSPCTYRVELIVRPTQQRQSDPDEEEPQPQKGKRKEPPRVAMVSDFCLESTAHTPTSIAEIPFHTLRFESIAFHPWALKALPLCLGTVCESHSSVKAVGFKSCSVVYDACMREPSFLRYKEHEDELLPPQGNSANPKKGDAPNLSSSLSTRYRWGEVNYLDCSESGGEPFWTCVRQLVCHPQLESAKGEVTSSLVALVLSRSMITAKQLEPFMLAVGERNMIVRAKHDDAPTLRELDLSFIKRVETLSWMKKSPTLCAELRLLALARTDMIPEVLLEGLAAAAGKRFWLLDIRWNQLTINDVMLRELMKLNIYTDNIRIAGTDITQAVAKEFATHVSP